MQEAISKKNIPGLASHKENLSTHPHARGRLMLYAENNNNNTI